MEMASGGEFIHPPSDKAINSIANKITLGSSVGYKYTGEIAYLHTGGLTAPGPENVIQRLRRSSLDYAPTPGVSYGYTSLKK